MCWGEDQIKIHTKSSLISDEHGGAQSSGARSKLREPQGPGIFSPDFLCLSVLLVLLAAYVARTCTINLILRCITLRNVHMQARPDHLHLRGVGVLHFFYIAYASWCKRGLGSMRVSYTLDFHSNDRHHRKSSSVVKLRSQLIFRLSLVRSVRPELQHYSSTLLSKVSWDCVHITTVFTRRRPDLTGYNRANITRTGRGGVAGREKGGRTVLMYCDGGTG